MGKKELDAAFTYHHGMTFEDALENAPIAYALKIGSRICPSEHVVQQFNNPKSPTFYQNTKLLKRTIINTYSIGTYNQREQAQEIMTDLLSEN